MGIASTISSAAGSLEVSVVCVTPIATFQELAQALFTPGTHGGDGAFVIVMVGPAGSGKSTLAAKLQDAAWRMFRARPYALSSDALREVLTGDATNQQVTPKVFDMMHAILQSRCAHGQGTIFDATNLRAKDRKQILAIVKAVDASIPVTAILLPVDAETCLERQATRSRQVSGDVILRHVGLYGHTRQQITGEGFERVYEYAGS